MGAPHILTYNTGWGARHTGTGDGPQALLDYGLPAALGCTAEPLAITPTIQPAESVQTFSPQSLPIIAELNTQLSAAVAQTLRNKQRALVLGGDHSCAIGTWSGAAQALNACSNFGLIWIDAHMDAHTPQTRHEGAWGGHWHGQPLACLLGAGEPALTRIGGNRAKLNPAHVTLIGIRSYEPGEKAFLEKMNVRIAYMEEVQQRGFAAVFAEALQRAEQAAGGFGVTIDLDAFCPQDAPGVGTPEQGGLRAAEVLPVLGQLVEHKKFHALELPEYNPHHDVNHKTAKLATALATAALGAAAATQAPHAGIVPPPKKPEAKLKGIG